MRQKVLEQPQLEKDTDTKAVLNVDNRALNSYKIQREKMKKTLNAIDEVEKLKEDMAEIKSLLNQILQRQ